MLKNEEAPPRTKRASRPYSEQKWTKLFHSKTYETAENDVFGPKKCSIFHVYLNSVQQMVSGELAGEGLQTGFSRHGLPPQRAPLDTVYPLREHLNSVSEGCPEGAVRVCFQTRSAGHG